MFELLFHVDDFVRVFLYMGADNDFVFHTLCNESGMNLNAI